MVRASWNGQIIAESDHTVVVEGNHYFPPESVQPGFLVPSTYSTGCPWKGTASYHSVVVDGAENPNAAWYYPFPLPAAAEIADHIRKTTNIARPFRVDRLLVSYLLRELSSARHSGIGVSPTLLSR